MAYRETVIDGRVFLEIVDEPYAHEEAAWERAPEVELDEDESRGVWIGDLVPDHAR